MTKVICIENKFSYEYLDELIEGAENLVIGDIYGAEFLPNYYDGYNTCDHYIIDVNSMNERYIKYKAKYFMPLAEWREQQINSILDENS